MMLYHITDNPHFYGVEIGGYEIKIHKSQFYRIYGKVSLTKEELLEVLIQMELVRQENMTEGYYGGPRGYRGKNWYRKRDFPERLETLLRIKNLNVLIQEISELKQHEVEQYFWGDLWNMELEEFTEDY